MFVLPTYCTCVFILTFVYVGLGLRLGVPRDYVQAPAMDVVDSLSTATSGTDAVPSLDFDLITTGDTENLWCEQCKVFKKVIILLFYRTSIDSCFF